MPSTPLYEFDDVSLAIDDVTILDGIDLVIPDEGITVLAGPSGAGKSMLLRLLNRLEVRTGGQIRFRGDPIDTLDPLALRRRVGMVFQWPAPFPGTVRDNLLVADPTASDDELAAALDDARLDPSFLDRSADDLSGGEAQRMCLARTLVTQPEALLMDEPTSALDPDARHRLERTARRLADAGRPLVWVTHDLEQADRLADDVVVLVAGRIATGDERTRFLTNAGRATDADTDPSRKARGAGAAGETGGAGAAGETGGAGAAGETGAADAAEDQEDARG